MENTTDLSPGAPQKKKSLLWLWILLASVLVILTAGAVVYANRMPILRRVSPNAYLLTVSARTASELAKNDYISSLTPENREGTLVKKLSLGSDMLGSDGTSFDFVSAFDKQEQKMLFTVNAVTDSINLKDWQFFVTPEIFAADISLAGLEYSYITADFDTFENDLSTFTRNIFGQEMTVKGIDTAMEKVFGIIGENEPVSSDSDEDGSESLPEGETGGFSWDDISTPTPAVNVQSISGDNGKETIFRHTFDRNNMNTMLDDIGDRMNEYAGNQKNSQFRLPEVPEDMGDVVILEGPIGFGQVLVQTVLQLSNQAGLEESILDLLDIYGVDTGEIPLDTQENIFKRVRFSEDATIEYTITKKHLIRQVDIQTEIKIEGVEEEVSLSFTLKFSEEQRLGDKVEWEAVVEEAGTDESIRISGEMSPQNMNLELFAPDSDDAVIAFSLDMEKTDDSIRFYNGKVAVPDGLGVRMELLQFSYDVKTEAPEDVFGNISITEENSRSVFDMDFMDFFYLMSGFE